jgi:TM2 domain-containing membrane protein YozV
MRICSTIIFCFVLALSATAQESMGNDYEELNFIIHLANNNLFKEAEKEKSKAFRRANLNPLFTDSVNFALGQAYYGNHQYQMAKWYFKQISEKPFFYYKAKYLAGLIEAENMQVDSSLAIFSSIEISSNPDLNELQTFELAGVNLLKGNFSYFDSVVRNEKFKHPMLVEEFTALKNIYVAQKSRKTKSAFLAGSLSAVIPGLGKVYVGNNAQGFASFLTCGLMAGITIENYLRLGGLHPQTILFGGLFGLFYVGNIWGSALSVQIIKKEKSFEDKHNLLVGLRIPVSKFFN